MDVAALRTEAVALLRELIRVDTSNPPGNETAAAELLRDYLESERSEILDNGIRLNAIGEVDRLPRYVREPLERIREESRKNTGMTLTLALSYGGREELVHAARGLAEAAARGEVALERLEPGTPEHDRMAQQLKLAS